ncbi:MAG: hydrogenase maturation nickel metallochaperone HypA [Saccharofermentanales bacterium]
MHDYHKAVEMVEYAKAKAGEQGKSKVTKIIMTIGEASGYSPDSVLMYFNDVSQGTLCEGAEVEMKIVKPMMECPECHEIFPRVIMKYECPKCGKEGIPSKIGTIVAIEGIETGEI